jgi:hypothetical protein
MRSVSYHRKVGDYIFPGLLVTLLPFHEYTLDSSVGTAKGHGLDRPGSIPGKGKTFFSSTASRPALGPIQPSIQIVPGALSPEVKRPGREADNSPPSSAEVKIGEAIPPFPHTCS